jgi:hypothetical protein
MAPSLLLLLSFLFLCGQASSRHFLKRNNFQVIDGISSDQFTLESRRSLGEETCSGITSVSCATCLNGTFTSSLGSSVLYDYAYCVEPEFCYLLDGSTNSANCKRICSGGSHKEDDDNKCDSLSYSLAAIIVSLILFICCPMMLVCGCFYVCYQRCVVIFHSKVHIAPGPNHNPMPMLQVLQFNADGYEEFAPSRLAPAVAAVSSRSSSNASGILRHTQHAQPFQPSSQPSYALIHSAAVVVGEQKEEEEEAVALSPHARAVAVVY